MTLPDLSSELSYKATRGSGPGGQHVNKTSTQVALRWSLPGTAGFSESEIERLSAKLRTRLTLEGDLILTDHSTRSQARNREIVTERFYELLREALKVQKPRRKTKPSLGAKRRRLKAKRLRSDVKAGRGRVR